jgi:hypothetical protein
VRSFVQEVRRLKLQSPHEFEWPFNVADAGWLLQIMARSP